MAACFFPMPSDSTEAPAAPVTEASPPALVEELYRRLAAKALELRPREDSSPLERAYRFAAGYHSRQTRDSGEPYVVHPLNVALILAEMNMDLVCLQVGLLHDVLEDTGATAEELRKNFGEEVARCVDGVTKLSKLKFYDREERQAESVRKMLLAMVDDVRVVIVKLADRLHNMRTLAALSPERQQRISQETLDIYAPIAHRLGMGRIRGELEDLAFRYLEPDASAEIMAAIDSKRSATDEFLKQIKDAIDTVLRREGIPARIEGRIKRAYSIHQKMKRQKIGMEQVYDVLAVRVVTDCIRNCYAALGVIHNEWRPIPGRIKDFVAIPRPNLYQSLHTSVMGPGGQPFEVQIRTEEMHRIAEQGIAAHWKYKEGRKDGQDDQHIAWLRHLLEWIQEMRDPGEFMSTLKVDLYREEVYTFTPRGKVIVLPREATPIDFAYAIHTAVGHGCVGAKVNGRIVPLRYELRNGDVVEILTQPGHMPSKDWLALARTPRARNKIKTVINATERAKAIEIGQKYLEKEARRIGVALSKVTKADLERVAAEYGFAKVEDLHAALGYGKFSPRKVLQKISPESVDAEPEPGRGGEGAVKAPGPPPGTPDTADLVIRVKGMDDLLVYRAKCCNPIRGESIVGYVTRGKGVAVHATSCSNVQNLMYEVERRIDVEWARSASESFPVKFLVHTADRPGMLSELTSVLFNENSNIRSLEARSTEHEGAVVDMTVDVRDKKQLERIVSAMRRLSGIRDIERL
jgi:GTP diphosphokinase / guanosine-3',5'-bis(diphosphate) 3'-diphosphatase